MFDDGAQFFTVRDPRFGEFVDEWIGEGLVLDWFHSHLIRGGGTHPDGHPRYCGVRGMRSITEHLAGGLTVRTGCEVVVLEAGGKGWSLHLAEGEKLEADALLLTPPAPASLALLAESGLVLSGDAREELQRVEYTPCIAVLAVLDGPSALTEWGAVRVGGDTIDWIADNQRKGISPAVTAITIQAMPGFSREHWDEDDRSVGQRLLDSAAKLLLAGVKGATVHRWRLGKPVEPYPRTYAEIAADPPGLLAGDAFKGYRVEGATLSGFEAAERLVRELGL
ncbi:MAG TPA: hypothetical protein ENI92_01605 [Bacteroidetes bacterium]|nr:hypothetical protein [Bacteroidota bacterium]